MTRFATLALCLLSPAAFAQPAKTPPKTPWANKLFLTDVLTNPAKDAPPVIAHDFGTVPAGTLSSHTFTFTNIYDVPLQVVDVRVECGCLKAYPPNKVLQPNESADFTVTMNAALFKGAASKKMLVTVGPSYVSTAELRFTATSRDDVAITAPGMIDFGIVPQGKSTERAVTLKYTGKVKDWKVEPANAPAGVYTVDVKESSRGEVLGTAYTVTVGLKDSAPPGPLADALLLKTNDPNTPTISVAIGGRVQPPVRVAGDGLVVFEGVPAGTTKDTRVMIEANAACKLTAETDQGDGVSVDIFPHSHQLHIVTVRYEAKKGAGPIRKEVRLKTDLPGQPDVSFVVEVR